MKRLRCCHRFAYWSIPLGPWRCAGRCGREFDLEAAGVPRRHLARFWEAVDAQVAATPELTPAQLELLEVFQ